MVFGATIIFFIALVGIAALFILKLWEESRAQILVPNFRSKADAGAVKCKQILIRGERLLSKVPSLTAYIALNSIAASAVGFAHLARSAAEAAHRLADLVSHKHNFERRETRSEFLKQVSEYQKKETIFEERVQITTDVAEIFPKTRRKKAGRDIDVRT